MKFHTYTEKKMKQKLFIRKAHKSNINCWDIAIPKTLDTFVVNWHVSGKVLDMGQQLADRTNLVVVDGFIDKTFKTKDLNVAKSFAKAKFKQDGSDVIIAMVRNDNLGKYKDVPNQSFDIIWHRHSTVTHLRNCQKANVS
jgi:hypothetical protein